PPPRNSRRNVARNAGPRTAIPKRHHGVSSSERPTVPPSPTERPMRPAETSSLYLQLDGARYPARARRVSDRPVRRVVARDGQHRLRELHPRGSQPDRRSLREAFPRERLGGRAPPPPRRRGSSRTADRKST